MITAAAAGRVTALGALFGAGAVLAGLWVLVMSVLLAVLLAPCRHRPVLEDPAGYYACRKCGSRSDRVQRAGQLADGRCVPPARAR